MDSSAPLWLACPWECTLGLGAFPPILLHRLLPYVHVSLKETGCGRPQTPTGLVTEVERWYQGDQNALKQSTKASCQLPEGYI